MKRFQAIWIRTGVFALVLFLFFTVLFPPEVSWADRDQPQVEATAVVLMDLNSNTILYEKNADQVLEPASITKVMTGLLALEHLDLEDEITVDQDYNVSGNVLDLKKGEVLTVEDLLYGMLLYSANDAAIVLAEAIAGSVPDFCVMADDRAAQLGATHTVYQNPNGLNDVSGHVTTAGDQALICAEAMKNETFRKIVSTASYTIPANSVSKARKLTSTNLLLYDDETEIVVGGTKRTPLYEGAMGVKTGETSTAGACLVAAALRDDTQLLAVVLDSPDSLSRFEDGISLLDYGFDHYYSYLALPEGQVLGKVDVSGSRYLHVAAVPQENCWVTLPKEASASLLEEKITWEKGLSAPLAQGTKVGTVTYTLAGEEVASFVLVSADAAQKGGPWTSIGVPDPLAYSLLGILLVAALLLLVILVRRRNLNKSRERKLRLAKAKAQQVSREETENKKKRDWPY